MGIRGGLMLFANVFHGIAPPFLLQVQHPRSSILLEESNDNNMDALQDPISFALHLMTTRELCAMEATCRIFREAVAQEWVRRDALRRHNGTRLTLHRQDETPRDREILFCQTSEFAQQMEWQDYRHNWIDTEGEKKSRGGDDKCPCRTWCSDYPHLYSGRNFGLDSFSYFVRLTKWKDDDDEAKTSSGALLWQGGVNNDCRRNFAVEDEAWKYWTLQVPSTANDKDNTKNESDAIKGEPIDPTTPLIRFALPELCSMARGGVAFDDPTDRDGVLDKFFTEIQLHVTVVAVMSDAVAVNPQRALVISSWSTNGYFNPDDNEFSVHCDDRQFDPHNSHNNHTYRACSFLFKCDFDLPSPMVSLTQLCFEDEFFVDVLNFDDFGIEYDREGKASLFHHDWDQQTGRRSRRTNRVRRL